MAAFSFLNLVFLFLRGQFCGSLHIWNKPIQIHEVDQNVSAYTIHALYDHKLVAFHKLSSHHSFAFSFPCEKLSFRLKQGINFRV